MAGSPPNLHTMDSRSACIQDVLKVKVKVKSHVIRALFWILGMSYSVIDGLVVLYACVACVLSRLIKRILYCTVFAKDKDVFTQPLCISAAVIGLIWAYSLTVDEKVEKLRHHIANDERAR